MFSETAVDPALLQAYLETEYRVHEDPGFILRVGSGSPELLAAHKLHKVSCSAFLTACNPLSVPVDVQANRARQAELAKELARRSLTFLPGVGQHPSNGWPGEDSFLVFGLTLEAAKALAGRLEQNGFVWSASDAVPQLILLR